MPRIYVPHMVTKYNPARGRVTPALDFTPALRFGDLKYVLNDDYKPEFFGDTFEKISEALADVKPDDFFIPTGDPALISLCAAEIVRRTGRINILRWERASREYFPATAVYEIGTHNVK